MNTQALLRKPWRIPFLHFLQHSSAFRKWSTVTGLCLMPLIPSTAIKLDDLHRNGFSFASELSEFTSVIFFNYFATTFRLISWYYFFSYTSSKENGPEQGSCKLTGDVTSTIKCWESETLNVPLDWMYLGHSSCSMAFTSCHGSEESHYLLVQLKADGQNET